MKFTVPAASPEKTEETYVELARVADSLPAPHGRRVAKVAFTHDGDEWVAEVGQPLRGKRTKRSRRKGHSFETTQPLSDPAIVLAIFEGVPTKVVTDARPLTTKASYWCNPFLVGTTAAFEYFDP